MKILRTAAVAAALASAALLAACSGNGTTSSTSGSTSTGSSSLSGSPLKVLVMSADKNSVYEFPTVWTMAEDFAKMQNAAGGVNGHPIQVITCNDQADPNMAVTCAREAVADKVTALVGGLTLYDNAVFPIISAAGIPWIGLNPERPQRSRRAGLLGAVPVHAAAAAAVGGDGQGAAGQRLAPAHLLHHRNLHR